MSMGRGGGGKLSVRRLGDRSKARVLVLLYHRVADLSADPWALSVTPCHFAEHLEVLRRYTRPLRLREAINAHRDGALPRRAVVVTFDDGYADNLQHAKPALERSDVPATIFLTVGALGREREFWWDELERLLLQPDRLPDELRLRIGDGTLWWRLGEASKYGEEAGYQHRRWLVWEPAPTPRHAVYRALWEVLLPLPVRQREQILEELREWAGAEPRCRPTHRVLSLPEVAVLTEGGLIEIGAHTLTHPALAALPRDAQREEIEGSKARLEELVGGTVTSFAYPYGRQCDYTAETVALVREAAFSCACANVPGVLGAATNPFELPRVQVQDWGGQEFEKRLRRWLDG